jgi:hypothetical protein
LPATVAACLIKEIRYLLRSGPKLYVLIMPVFIVFLFSMRTSGMNYAGGHHNRSEGHALSYGCAYTQLIFVGLIYNSLGGDGAGVQFYFIAPMRMRDVMLAKNLLTFGIFAIEAILIYIVSAVISTPPLDLDRSHACLEPLHPLPEHEHRQHSLHHIAQRLDPARVRSQNVNGLSSLISLLVRSVNARLGRSCSSSAAISTSTGSQQRIFSASGHSQFFGFT